jgi:peroxiredoxin
MMTTLREQYAAIDAQLGKMGITPDKIEIMQRAKQELRESGAMEHVLRVGAKAPEFHLRSISGHMVDTQALLARGPLVINFYRGVWCPYCNAELAAMQTVLPEIKAAGATLVAISPQLEEHSQKAARQNKLEFDVLLDPGNKVAAQYGLKFTLPEYLRTLYKGFGIDLTQFNGDDSWTLPIASRFIVDQAGIIRSVDANADYTVRPEPSATVAFLKNLKTRS